MNYYSNMHAYMNDIQIVACYDDDDRMIRMMIFYYIVFCHHHNHHVGHIEDVHEVVYDDIVL
jgi:hypothetical protein